VERVKQIRLEMDYLNPEEIRRLLEASDADCQPLFATAVLTGARQGEILALRWSDYDPVRRVLFIRRAFHPVYGFTAPKSAAGLRAINVSPELAAILEDYRVRTYGKGNDLVFTNGVGNPIDGTNLLRQKFHPTLDRAGLRRIRFHDLRHTNVALRIAAGENMKSIQAQLGYASITTTMDRYGHLLPQASDGSVERLDALIFDRNVVPFPAVRTASQA
jgi:integrase